MKIPGFILKSNSSNLPIDCSLMNTISLPHKLTTERCDYNNKSHTVRGLLAYYLLQEPEQINVSKILENVKADINRFLGDEPFVNIV